MDLFNQQNLQGVLRDCDLFGLIGQKRCQRARVERPGQQDCCWRFAIRGYCLSGEARENRGRLQREKEILSDTVGRGVSDRSIRNTDNAGPADGRIENLVTPPDAKFRQVGRDQRQEPKAVRAERDGVDQALHRAVRRTQVLAHVRPGRSWTIRAGAERTHLTIAMPLHELELPMPDRSGPVPGPFMGPVQDEAKARITEYLASHRALATASGEKLDVRLVDPRIERAQDDHVGAYDLLVIDLTSPVAAFPRMLRHDAMLHEVRSHHAAVNLQAPGADPVGIGVIRVDPATGEATVLTIPPFP